MFRVETPDYFSVFVTIWFKRISLQNHSTHFFAAGSASSVGTEYYLLPELREENAWFNEGVTLFLG